MIAKFYEIFIVEGSLLQTISNLLFLCVMIATVICLLKSFACGKAVSETSLTDVLFVDFFTAFCFMYNSKEKVLDTALHSKVQLGILAIVALFGVINILRQLFKKPIKNGTLLVTDGESQKQITGEEYNKEFAKRKAKNTIIVSIREIAKVISVVFIDSYVNILNKEFVALKGIHIDGAIIATISYYSIILAVGIIVVFIIDWILEKIF